MNAATDGLKSLLAIKIKPRQDGYCDQFIRIFMLKVMMAGTLIIGINWYTDKIICIIREDLKIDKDFVSSACWINGLYVYKEIKYHDDVGYFGIPRDINLDGKDSRGRICATTNTAHKRATDCKQMEKTFFLQYQYMTFLLLAMSLIYYAPYVVFRKVNEDMTSLKGSIKENDADAIVNNYFNEKLNPKAKLRLRILGDIFVKILYIASTVLAFLLLDSILNGGFITYGTKWLDWSNLKNSMAYDYMGKRHFPKPGNELLPSFGFCEVHESVQDIRTIVTNTHKFICEISQHILYQYVFIIIWFAMIVSIVVSVIGLLQLVIGHVLCMLCHTRIPPAIRSIAKNLALRECQYLEFIRRKNMPLYGQVIVKLKGMRGGGLVNAEILPDGPEPYEL